VAVGSTLHMHEDNRRLALQNLRQVVSSAQPMEARSQGVADILEAAGLGRAGPGHRLEDIDQYGHPRHDRRCCWAGRKTDM
ncbi:hypothetical protein, partial [Nocardia carnea]|uniref:hypothetical protein n=1 Tax=Nocardia carnea TaxID=37328 RepID=UPI0024550F44